jgi:general secretion pathway protein L
LLRKRIFKHVAVNPKRVLLRLSPSDVVERTIQIPRAANDVIEPILQNQMERIVPWAQESTRYGYRTVGVNAASPDQIDIHIVATTKTILDSALQQANSLGLKPFAVDYAPAFEEPSAVVLASLEPDPIEKTARRLNAFLALLVAVCATISGTGLYLVWDQQSERGDLETKIAAARSRLDEVKRLNEKDLQLRQQRQLLVKRKTEEPAIMILIEALSRTLPDTAYLTELEIHGRDARIVGKSDDPTALVTQLEGTPQFEDVHFSAPTTREVGERIGTFSIIGRAQGGPYLEKHP